MVGALVVSFRVEMVQSQLLEVAVGFLLQHVAEEVVVGEAFHSFPRAIVLRPSCVGLCQILGEVHIKVVDHAIPEAVVVDRFVIHGAYHHC